MDLMISHRNYQWLRILITGDEKWVLYIKCTHRRQWLNAGEMVAATPKTDPHPNKSDAEGLVGSQWHHSLKNSFKWFHYDRRSLLPATGSNS